MSKSFFENMPCVTEDSEEQEERELYEVAANYEDLLGVSAKKPVDADLNLAQVMELNRLTHEPTGLLDVC